MGSCRETSLYAMLFSKHETFYDLPSQADNQGRDADGSRRKKRYKNVIKIRRFYESIPLA